MIISKLRRLTIVAMGALVLSSAFVPNAAASCFDKKVRSLLKEKIKSGSDLSIQSKGGQCGHGVDIIDQFREQSLDLKFGDKTKKFIPIYLTDKYPDSWRCHRLKVRIGCVLKVEQRSKDAEVTLSSQPGGGWVKDRLIVSDAGKISYRGDVSGQLFLIPARSRFGGAVRIDIRPAISQAAEKFRAEVCDQRPYRKKYGRPTNCRRAVSYFVERQFYEKLRTYLRPTRKPLKVRRADKQEFIAKLGNLTDIKRRIHNSIWKNELGPRVSPYQLSDAVLAASGLSFGVRQWDIGVNSDGQNLFKKIINNSPSSTIAPTLARRSNAGYFFKPIRTMRISEYRFLMRSWEAIQTALDETLSREISVSA